MALVHAIVGSASYNVIYGGFISLLVRAWAEYNSHPFKGAARIKYKATGSGRTG